MAKQMNPSETPSYDALSQLNFVNGAFVGMPSDSLPERRATHVEIVEHEDNRFLRTAREIGGFGLSVKDDLNDSEKSIRDRSVAIGLASSAISFAIIDILHLRGAADDYIQNNINSGGGFKEILEATAIGTGLHGGYYYLAMRSMGESIRRLSSDTASACSKMVPFKNADKILGLSEEQAIESPDEMTQKDKFTSWFKRKSGYFMYMVTPGGMQSAVYHSAIVHEKKEHRNFTRDAVAVSTLGAIPYKLAYNAFLGLSLTTVGALDAHAGGTVSEISRTFEGGAACSVGFAGLTWGAYSSYSNVRGAVSSAAKRLTGNTDSKDDNKPSLKMPLDMA
jgi:hypothetical protein